ncbi:gluconokinase [Jiangella asiatica]|uniref:Gluconokinase n=1 Tax=Jiangella asiatica TaxID=2530372 RepID=A0A4V2Z0B8_9ACTN|nr:gluconokinase [Jiangella asiatica]TDE00328.1 gluconokinase [Jiangella asiatica]
MGESFQEIACVILVRVNTVAHLVVMGVSGSGKTTVAKRLADRLGRPFVEADDMHPPANVAKMAAGTPLTDADRWPWLELVRDWLSEQTKAGRCGVITCSALRRSYRDILRGADGHVRFVHLDGDPEVIAERMRKRQGHFMPPSLLRSQLDTLEPLEPDEDGVRVPIDGTPDEIADEALKRLGLSDTGDS